VVFFLCLAGVIRFLNIISIKGLSIISEIKVGENRNSSISSISVGHDLQMKYELIIVNTLVKIITVRLTINVFLFLTRT